MLGILEIESRTWRWQSTIATKLSWLFAADITHSINTLVIKGTVKFIIRLYLNENVTFRSIETTKSVRIWTHCCLVIFKQMCKKSDSSTIKCDSSVSLEWLEVTRWRSLFERFAHWFWVNDYTYALPSIRSSIYSDNRSKLLLITISTKLVVTKWNSKVV